MRYANEISTPNSVRTKSLVCGIHCTKLRGRNLEGEEQAPASMVQNNSVPDDKHALTEENCFPPTGKEFQAGFLASYK
jgi:hypothetical protein